MAQKLFTAEEAARMLGITTDQLNAMRDRREVFGIRDGGGWKYKEQEIERVKADSGKEDESVFELPQEMGPGDSVLLSEVELGEPGSSLSGTVIGRPGTGSPHDSDISLLDVAEFRPESKAKPESKTKAEPKAKAKPADDDLFPMDMLDEKASGVNLDEPPKARGKPGGMRPSDSDVALAALDESPSATGSGSGKKPDSDVTLVPDISASDSGVKLVASSPAGGDLSNTIELELSDLALGESSSDMPLELGSGTGSSGLGGSRTRRGGIGSDIHGAATGSKEKSGSDLTLDSDALGAGGDVLGLGDSNLHPGGSKTGSGSGGHGSAIELGVGEFEDDDLVLGSHTGSDINDSGISLADPADSGLSLEQPLQLGGDDMVDGDSGMGGQLTADDEFMLTPAVEMGEEELDESGSQVIALDSEADFDDSAATLLGESLPGGGILEEDTSGFGAQPMGPLGAAAAMGGPMLAPTQMVVARETPYSIFNVISLFVCFGFLSLTGMFMWDLMRNMWSWDAPYQVNSSMMDSIIAMFE